MKNNKIRVSICVALQISLILLLMLNDFAFNVNSFNDRIMGNGLMDGIDVGKRINMFYMCLFLLIPAITVYLTLVFKQVFSSINKNVLKFVELISILGIINIIIAVNNQCYGNFSMLSILVLVSINLVIIIMYIINDIKHKKINFYNLKWSIIAGFPCAFLLISIFKFVNTTTPPKSLLWIIFYIISIVFLFMLSNRKRINRGALKKSYIAFLLAPLLEFIYIEVYNVLNQYDIIISQFSKVITIFVIYNLCLIVTLILYYFFQNRSNSFNWEKYYYPIIVIFVSFMVSAIPLKTVVSTDFFESANHGLGIYELFRFGKIPIIENFDAHMFSNEIFGIIYGVINQDILGSMFCLYSSYNYVIFAIIMYFLLNKFFSKDAAFLSILFLFFDEGLLCSIDGLLKTYTISFLVIFTLLKINKNKSFKNFLLYWILLVFMCLWQLDIGFPIIVSSIIVLMIMIYKDRKNNIKIIFKNLFYSLILVLFFCVICYLCICLKKNINPILRIIEFLRISMSNINWGRATVYKGNILAYVVCYFMLPLLILYTIIYTIYTIYKNKFSLNTRDVILLSIGLFYIFNFQRGLVRHSLVESRISSVLGFSILYIALFISNWKYRNSQIFIVIYSLMTIIGSLIMPAKYVTNNIFDMAITNYTTFDRQYEYSDSKVERVQLSVEMKKEYEDLKIVMDSLLKENETFLDFTNQTLLYPLFDKEKPVYVNQSPGLLSGELSQQLYIKEIKESKKDVPIVIRSKKKFLSNEIDRISNDYRYYLVSEFIFNNYKFIGTVNDYDIWAKNEIYEEKLDILNKIESVDIEFSSPVDNSTVYLGQIPFIWGKYDEKINNAIVQQELAKDIILDNSAISIDTNFDDIDKTSGNYIIINAETYDNCMGILEMNLYSGENIMESYKLILKKGNNNYVIRISTLDNWYTDKIDKITVASNLKCNIHELKLLKGDTIKEF